MDTIKKPVGFILYRLFLFSGHLLKSQGFFLFGVSVFLFCLQSVNPAYSIEKISLKKYKTQAIKVGNPIELSRLPLNKTFQVNSSDFVLQFFFSGPDILGIVLKRNLNKALFVKWCFFRNCEESPFNYVSVLAQPNSPPLANGFFEIKHPPGLNYNFQGLHFYTRD